MNCLVMSRDNHSLLKEDITTEIPYNLLHLFLPFCDKIQLRSFSAVKKEPSRPLTAIKCSIPKLFLNRCSRERITLTLREKFSSRLQSQTL